MLEESECSIILAANRMDSCNVQHTATSEILSKVNCSHKHSPLAVHMGETKALVLPLSFPQLCTF